MVTIWTVDQAIRQTIVEYLTQLLKQHKVLPAFTCKCDKVEICEK